MQYIATNDIAYSVIDNINSYSNIHGKNKPITVAANNDTANDTAPIIKQNNPILE